jgi:hypothetical protein
MDLNTRAEVLEQIRRKGRGWVFTARDFPATHDPEAVRATLRKLQRAGQLKKITTGVFHFPRTIRDLGIEVPPDPLKVAKAVARLRGHRIALSGAAAANRLGLTTQVPAKPVYLTDGPSKEIQLGKMTIVLRHAPAECVRVGGDLERAIVQALFYLGPEGIDDKTILKLRRAVPPARRNRLLAAARRVGGWVEQVLQQIVVPLDDAAVGHG